MGGDDSGAWRILAQKVPAMNRNFASMRATATLHVAQACAMPAHQLGSWLQQRYGRGVSSVSNA
jgi:hypothetical protein